MSRQQRHDGVCTQSVQVVYANFRDRAPLDVSIRNPYIIAQQ